MVTKVGCVVVGVHGSDTFTAGLRQMWNGRTAKSLTEQTAGNISRALGAAPETADNIALAVDIAVPLGFATLAGAARFHLFGLGESICLSMRHKQAVA